MGTERIIKNHMDILWHEYTDAGGEERPVTEASLTGGSVSCFFPVVRERGE